MFEVNRSVGPMGLSTARSAKLSDLPNLRNLFNLAGLTNLSRRSNLTGLSRLTGLLSPAGLSRGSNLRVLMGLANVPNLLSDFPALLDFSNLRRSADFSNLTGLPAF